MSRSKDRREAQRWLETAAEDLRAAQALVEAGFHAHACFTAQQSAEKAMKAAWYLIGEAPWGHSIQRLVMDFPQKEQLPLEKLLDLARTLDRLYVPTRYPNGLPDFTPEQNFCAADSRQALDLAECFLKILSAWVNAGN